MFIYVDWEKQIVKTQEEVEKEIDDLFENNSCDEEFLSFDDYLSENYTPSAIFNFDVTTKCRVLEEYKGEVYYFIKEAVYSKYEEIELII